MGRHSAADDEDDTEDDGPDDGPDLLDLLVSERPVEHPSADVQSTPTQPTPTRGRHAVPDDDDDTLAGNAPDAARKARHKGSGTRGDLRLMRQDHALLARCVASVIVPFVLYTLALLVAGRLSAYLLWLWIPAILAGVLLGAFLDSAHRRAQDEPAA